MGRLTYVTLDCGSVLLFKSQAPEFFHKGEEIYCKYHQTYTHLVVGAARNALSPKTFDGQFTLMD